MASHLRTGLVLMLVASCGGGGSSSESSSTDAETTTSVDTSTSATTSSTTSGATDGPVTDSTATDGPLDSSSTTGTESCPAPSMCLEAAPLGWAGPFALHTLAKGMNDNCGGAYGVPAESYFGDAFGDPAICECSCESAGSTNCPTEVTLLRWSEQTCTDAFVGSWALESDQTCNSLVTGAASTYWTAEAEVPATCAVDTETEMLPEKGFATEHALCDTTMRLGICDDGSICYPGLAQPYEQMCVTQNGEQPCPEGMYTEQLVAHGDLEDTRACTNCTCDAPTGACTGYVVQLHSTDGCGQLAGQITTTGTCQQSGASPTTAARVGGNGVSDVSCDSAANGGTPTGAVTPIAPVTLCCTPL